MLVLRVASAIVAGPAVLLVAWLGGPPLGLLCLGVSACGIEEIARMAAARGVTVCRPLAHLLGIAFLAAAYAGEAGVLMVLPAVAAVASLSVAAAPHRGYRVPDAVATLAAVLYVPHLIAYILLLRNLALGERLVVFALAITWMTDSAAYFAGTRFGRHKMCPALSPKKSWEGAAAGALSACALAGALGPWTGFTLAGGAGAGLVASVFAQAGDLVESALKRYTGVKDSGRLIPGHGGVLDRCDSLMFAAPAVYLLVLMMRI